MLMLLKDYSIINFESLNEVQTNNNASYFLLCFISTKYERFENEIIWSCPRLPYRAWEN